MKENRKRTLLSLVALLLFIASVMAQDNTRPSDIVVGAIGGSGGAGALGGAAYTIPIQVPEGLGGLKPELAVSYNSQGNNGLLGWCWDLQGVSAITRMGTTRYHDDKLSGVDFNNDRFALDGQRLICVKGKNCENSEFRTEADCMARIVAYGCDTVVGIAYFKVWLANGNIAYYGNSAGSRIGLQQHNDVCLWLLNRIEDRNGNYMEYHYDKGGASYSLRSIHYGGNSVTGIPCSYTVRFAYSVREDTEISFIGDNTLDHRNRLDTVSVMHGSKVLHKYWFDYYSPTSSNGYYYTRLHRVNFSCDGESYGPTVIEWGENDYASCGSSQARPIGVNGGGSPSEFSDQVKFTGDFNGDGYTDFIIRKVIFPSQFLIGVLYLSNGDVLGFPSFTRHQDTILLDDHIDWIYAADINGDGLDDIVTSNRNRTSIGKDKLTIEAYLSSVGSDGTYSFTPAQQSFGTFWIKKKYKESILVGDFMGEGKQSILLQECEDGKSAPRLFYITCSNGVLSAQQLPQNMVIDADRMFACDFNGDGISEIWFANNDTNTTGLLRMDRTLSNYSFVQVSGSLLTVWHQLFPGDFNGDGKTDVLSYVEDGNGNGSWHLNYFKETALRWPAINITVQTMGIGDPGTHAYSLEYLNEPDYKFVTVGDFNGDGKADVAVRTEDNTIKYLYGPVRNVNGQGQFSSTQTVSLGSIGMTGASNQTICAGNFLGRENLSLFSKTTMHSLNPISNRYNVVGITDGMGNRTEFEYDYLMPKPMIASDNDFYVRAKQTVAEQASEMFTVSLPLKGMSGMTVSNLFCQGRLTEQRYRYRNAMVHKGGRGFLGFKSVTEDSWLSSWKQPTVTRTSETVFTVPSLALKLELVSSVTGSTLTSTDNDNAVLLRRDPESGSINKVFVPVVGKQTCLQYDPYHPQNLLTKTIREHTYNDTVVNASGYGQVRTYSILKQTDMKQGVDTAGSVSTVSACEFQTLTHTDYYAETASDLADWIVNRPYSVRSTARRLGGYSDISSLTVYRYANGASGGPFLPSCVLNYPGGVLDDNDPLATFDSTTYSSIGLPKIRLSGDIASRLPVRRQDSYYSGDGRFLTEETNSAGYMTLYRYDPNYGFLCSETDCNGLATGYETSPLGSWSATYPPDGDVSQSETSWIASNDALAPTGACYVQKHRYRDEREKRTYFDASGRKLRVVTPGMTTEKVFTDFVYDSRGLLAAESLPYFHGADTVYWTHYYHDNYNRLYYLEHPDGVTESVGHFGLKTIHVRVLGPNDQRATSTTVNAAGWTVKSTDEEGHEVRFDHYADGKLKSSQVGSDVGTAITIAYDNAGNRVTLTDPDYGTTRSTFDAYGQLTATLNPTGETTTYEYDVLGRMVKRYEYNRIHAAMDSTRWYYSDYPGTKGLINSIKFNGKEQVLYYFYDTLNRVSTVSEMRSNVLYETHFTYDSASRVATVTYPSGFVMRKHYTPTGHLDSLFNADTDVPLWVTESKNASGQVTRCHTGDGVTTARSYDPSTGRLAGIVSWKGNDTIQNLSYVFDKSANLASRKDRKRNMEERFIYDNLDRLTGVIEGSDTTGVFVYDAYGRMTSKYQHGAMVFDRTMYGAGGRPHALQEARMFADLPEQSIRYTSFDKLQNIRQDDYDLNYEYGYEHQRVRMTEAHMLDTLRKEYVGSCEFVKQNGVAVSDLTFISGPIGVFAVLDSRILPVGKGMYYVHPDHLGSWTTVTDKVGNVRQDVRFDPWGTPYYSDSTHLVEAATLRFDRGFTGHEHMVHFGLVNMNGRVYDPVTSTFLSVDNYVQDPSSTQNFNRYAYCLNNPLKYTDPDGESILAVSMIIGSLVCAYIGGTAANGWHYNPCSWSWDGNTWAGIGIGAVAGAAAGAAFACAAPALASTTFMSHFGTSGIMTSYTLSGFATLGTGGYAAGFGGGMLYSNGDTHYSHLSGIQGFKVGATLGALAGQLAGEIVTYKPPRQSYSMTIEPESKWKGNYFQGTEEEARQSLVETSILFKTETAMWYTSRGYYFEPIYGEAYSYNKEFDFDENVYKLTEYNIPVGPQTNTINKSHLFTKLELIDEALYLYPTNGPVSKVYYRAHTHPHNSTPSGADYMFSFLFGIPCRVYGWNGFVYYYGGPGYWH